MEHLLSDLKKINQEANRATLVIGAMLATDWVNLPIDTPVICADNLSGLYKCNDKSHIRFYAGYREESAPESFLVFGDGRTSVNQDQTTRFKYCLTLADARALINENL
jgi:hypothetical protein